MHVKLKNGEIMMIDRVTGCHVGGGVVRTIPVDEVEEWDYQIPQEYELTSVGFENCEVCRGYVHTHDRWNGWRYVFIEEDQIDFILEYFSNDAHDETYDPYFTWENKRLAIVWPEEEDGEDVIEPQTITYNGKEVTVYDISCGLCWEVVTEIRHSVIDDHFRR